MFNILLTKSTIFNSVNFYYPVQAPQGNRSYLPPGAVPSQNGVLSPQAAEFWFPECRNCPCCNGYKHGCPCRSNGSTSCTDPRCLSTEPVPGAPAATGPPATRPAVAPLSGARAPGGPEVCRFFASPSGCRSGSSCRFYHPGGSANNSASNTPRDAQTCIYFQRGFCQFGASCRFSHT